MCLKFLTNVFTELAVHAHNATETQITNGLLKIQNGFYSDIYIVLVSGKWTAYGCPGCWVILVKSLVHYKLYELYDDM